jgi:autotransporter-associated beta strand protein
VNSPGTLDLNGFSPTINGLSGNGNINNSSATVPTLTVGNNNTTVNWGGTINNTGAGIALIKVGSGNAIVTGTNYLRDTHQSQINGGTLLITNGGYFNDTAGQYWIAGAAATTATNIVDGGTLVVNNLLGVGARSATANGTLIVNSGTVQKTGGNNIAVGSGGASGTLIVNGGQVLNSGQLWLGDGATANAYLYLNGGLIQASAVEYYTAAAVPVNYIAYFNGGTLQATASSTNFLQVACYVQAGGLILDDNGYTLTINSAALQEGGGGGLVKKGAGTVYLDVGNSYSGITLVTNGTLAGIGSLAGPVIVAPLGNLGAGDAGTNVGTLTINNNLTLQGNATLRINRDGSPTSDLVGGVANITYGGVLVLSNLSTTTLTTNDTFQLFSASDAVSGNFNNIVGLPGAGLAYSFNPASGMLNVVLAPLSGLRFTANPAISGTSLTISATNAGAGTVYLLTSTNVANPLNTWTPVWTNVLGGSGSFTTNLSGAVNPALQQQFYILSNPNN